MKKKILEKLIKYYGDCIEELSSDSYNDENYRDYLFDKSIFSGICYTSQEIFSVIIIDEKWVLKNCKYGNYWFKKPLFGSTKAESIDLLQKRLDLMKKILKPTFLERLKSLF